MKILYTYNGIVQRVGGVSRYFYEIYRRLIAHHNVDLETLFLTNDYFGSATNRKLHLLYFFKKSIRLRIFVEDLFQCFYLLFHHYDIIHDTGESTLIRKITRSPIVVTVHDMIPELFYTRDLRRHKRRYLSFHHADAIICVSENTKKDLLRFYPDLEEKPIRVIYHGFAYQSVSYNRIVQDDYILYLGSRYAEYKNFIFMLKAVREVLIKKKIKLVCTGLPFSKEERCEIERLCIQKNIENVGFVTDEDLANLYHYALCFVYPSKYEGFGIPILEAFSHSCPVCLSDSSCFPEIAGDAAMYFNPNDKKDLEEKILTLVGSEQKRNEFIAKGKERLKFFSWDKTAKQTERFYNEIIIKK